jgi:hypothetical protein
MLLDRLNPLNTHLDAVILLFCTDVAGGGPASFHARGFGPAAAVTSCHSYALGGVYRSGL